MIRFVNRKLSGLLASLAVAGILALPVTAHSKDKDANWLRISTPKTYVQPARSVAASRNASGEPTIIFKKKLRLKKQVMAYAPKRAFSRYGGHKVTARAIYGQARWVCTPSGFGRRASCSSRG